LSHLARVYRDSLALLTDLYQLTMAYGYWKSGTAEKQACFHLAFRKNPFGGGFAVACGLQPAIEYVESLRFQDEDLDYLAGIQGNDGRPLFEEGFLDHLRTLSFCCDLDAVPEGTVVFGQEPLVRVTGPLLVAQLLETPLLNLINFQTLIATKAARLRLAAGDDPILEFGLRRAQGIDGGLAAARAAYAGGCDGTSNVLAGKVYGIPVKGTHAHSWVLSFDSELEAFAAYAAALPNNCVFLVDTYDSLQGVRHAVEVGRKLREQGHEMIGVRLDSGDLAWLSREARRILDEAGFPEAQILASNDLDETLIADLKRQGAAIGVWGVGDPPGHRLGRSGAGRRLQADGGARAGERLAGPGQDLRADGEDHQPRHPPGPPLPPGWGVCGRRDLGRAPGARGRADNGRPPGPDAAQDHPGGRGVGGPAGAGLPRRGARLRSAGAAGDPEPGPRAARRLPRGDQALRQPAPLSGGAGARLLRAQDGAGAGGAGGPIRNRAK
jgi:nicotinic acid phosphoribosyltransferase